ncbi:MAG: MarR family transcriptional regulator [Actinobacteria bacterium]|nr:MarR family transcriptional regulator [Actinomycetota bacterium]
MANAKWLTDAEMRAWLGFVTNASDLLRSIERDLEPFGLDGGDYQLLAMLSDAPEHRMKMCDLAEILRLSRGGLTRRMEGVVSAKFVERVRDETDGRAAFAYLTPKGFAFLKKVAPHHVKSVRDQMIDLLSDSEIKALGTAFAKIGSHLRSAD